MLRGMPGQSHFLRLIGMVPVCLSMNGLAADRFMADFEAADGIKAHDGLYTSRVEASIIAGGPAGAGHCLQLRTKEPSTSCPCDIRRPIAVEKNLVLAFDHREEIEAGQEGAYLGMSFFVGDDQWFWASDEFTGKWRHVELPIGTLTSSSGKKVTPGLLISRIQLYGRVKEKTETKGQTRARMTVWLDNIRIHVAPRQGRLTDKIRTSFANPPMFNWARPRSAAHQKLQYSTDPAFPATGTTTVEPSANFHTPPAPLEPGAYYWRVWAADDLAEGWSDIERVTVLPEAHRFVTAPIPLSQIAAKPRPRLIEFARLREPGLSDKRKADLVKSAKKLYERGVPEHPGPHVPGDPRWPTWIEWYGKVAGSITGGTGRRLEDLGRAAMLTADPQVIGWAKELALKACEWDPEGGSAMSRGDIGAHHLLRGLNWCYDACRDTMTQSERERLAAIIVQRAEQFHSRLNPFRHGEANNHAWLQAFALAESGLSLLGDHPAAGDWAEYVRQLYLGRFLPCLGYQGDNNEGIGYWDYGLSFIIEYADMMRAACGIDLYAHPWLNQTAHFPMYCAPPNAWAVSFADTGMPNHGTRGPACQPRVRDLALRTRDPYALWYSGQREPVDGIVPRAPTDLPPSIHYRHIGVAIFNTSIVDGREGVTVAMHSGPYQAGHQHPDQNSFVIHAYGGKLAIDGGYYDWYGSPHFKAYSMNTLAHNTLLVNGEGQAACTEGADGKITSWFDSPAYGYVVGDASDPEIYRGALHQFERRILFIKPNIVVVHDLVATTKEPASFDWLLHAIVPIRADADGTFAIECPEAALRGRFLEPVWLSPEVTTGFPAEPVNRYSRDPVPKDKYFPEWILHARPPAPSREQDFVAVMQVQRRGDRTEPVAATEPGPAENARAARVKIGDRAHLILCRTRDARGPMRCGAFESDGTCAAVEFDASGKPGTAFAAGATYLRHAGRDLIRRKTPGCQSFP